MSKGNVAAMLEQFRGFRERFGSVLCPGECRGRCTTCPAAELDELIRDTPDVDPIGADVSDPAG